MFSSPPPPPRHPDVALQKWFLFSWCFFQLCFDQKTPDSWDAWMTVWIVVSKPQKMFWKAWLSEVFEKQFQLRNIMTHPNPLHDSDGRADHRLSFSLEKKSTAHLWLRAQKFINSWQIPRNPRSRVLEDLICCLTISEKKSQNLSSSSLRALICR